MFLSTSSLDSSGSLRIKSTALRNTSCPIPNWPVVVPFGNKAPPTPDSAIEGTRVLPARRWSNLAAHTSIVARSLNPIRLPEKLMALGADAPIPMSASGCFTTLNRSSKARTPFWPLNPYFFLLSFNGNNSSGKSLACLSSSMRLMYSGSSLMAFFVLPSDNWLANHLDMSVSLVSRLSYQSCHLGIKWSNSPALALRNKSTPFFQFSRTGVLGEVAPNRSANRSPIPPNDWRRAPRMALYQLAWRIILPAASSPFWCRSKTSRTSSFSLVARLDVCSLYSGVPTSIVLPLASLS